ncbi:MAG TPA: hypothetical protein VGA85_04840 [Dehalococcoidales bacterium]
MQDDCILVALGLPQLKVVAQVELRDRFEVTVIYRRKQATCPRGGQVTTKEHERRLQRKQDRKLRDKMVFLILRKRRSLADEHTRSPPAALQSRTSSTARLMRALFCSTDTAIPP